MNTQRLSRKDKLDTLKKLFDGTLNVEALKDNHVYFINDSEGLYTITGSDLLTKEFNQIEFDLWMDKVKDTNVLLWRETRTEYEPLLEPLAVELQAYNKADIQTIPLDNTSKESPVIVSNSKGKKNIEVEQFEVIEYEVIEEPTPKRSGSISNYGVTWELQSIDNGFFPAI